MIISVIFEMVGLSLIYPLISFVIGDFDNKYLLFLEEILNRFFESKINFKDNNSKDLLILASLFLFIYSLKALITLLLILFTSILTFKLQANISNKLFKKYLFQDYSDHLDSSLSLKIRNIITETQVFSVDFVIPSLVSLTDLLTVFGIGLVLFIFLPELSFISLLTIIIICSIYLLATKKTISKLGSKRQEFENMRIKFFNEGLNSLKELKVSQKENLFFNKFSIFNKRLSNVAIKQSFLNSAPQALLEYMAICFLIALIFYLSLNSSENFYLISSLGLFTAAFFKIIPCLYRLVSCFSRIRYSTPVLNLLYSELKKFFNPKLIKSKLNSFGSKNDSIVFQNINFKFTENSNFIFKDLNLNLNLGKCIGIKGKSGAGKSTFIDLILGLNKPLKGKIFFNKNKINSNISKYYPSIYYLPQSIYLIEDSILNNILFSEEKDYDKELLELAIEISDLKTFIKNSENGIDTHIGENGTKISGGQKQRIGIARAIYSKSNILILDESTNALDSETERKIVKSIKNLNTIQTIFLITHREKMLEFCELVLNVENQNISKSKS